MFLGLLCAGALLCGGCASQSMKGTPFYTGEYEVRRGPVEERVNIWPLLYYREPALSVLWPIGEKTEDHLAVRPFYSVYGLHSGKKVHNVLWPLGRFDSNTGDNRFFPVFWGDDYLNVFPLYWHKGDPFGDAGGRNAMFPLWSINRADGKYDAYFGGPLLHFKKWGTQQGWHVLPFYGDYRENGDRYSFAAWPLAHRWRNGGDSGSAVLPFYYSDRGPTHSTFFSLPYWSRRRNDDGSGWQLVPPLYYRRNDAGGSLVVAPFFGSASNALTKSSWQTVVPLFYRSSGPDGSCFVSLPWSAGRNKEGRQWQVAPPFYLRVRGEGSDTMLTPIYARGESAEGSRRWHAVVPLYYRGESDKGETLATFLGGYASDESGRRWILYPLLSGGRRTEDSGSLWFAAPLVHVAWDENGRRHHVLPLYYANSRTGTFLSPLGARWQSGDCDSTLVPPLLTLFRSRPERKDLWTLGGLGKASWGEKPGSSHLFPVFYNDPQTGRFMSPVYCSERTDDGKRVVLPLLLSGYAREGDRREIIGALGLFYNKTDPATDSKRGHLFPVYKYRDDKELYTPIFGWKKDPHEGFVYPFTPIVGIRTGDYTGGWVFPLFSRKASVRTGEVEGMFLWGRYWRKAERSGSHLIPIYGYENRGNIEEASISTNAYGRYGKRFWSLPALWYRNEMSVYPRPASTEGETDTVARMRRKKHGFFPLWSYSREDRLHNGRSKVKSSVLLALFDYLRKSDEAAEESGKEYVRSRVLWRLWHYERTGEEVSVDVFPAITYDRKRDDFKKVSFLWRLFRYERSAETGKKLDLFFIPIMRSGPKSAVATAE